MCCDFGLLIPCIGHLGDGNIHGQLMVPADDAAEVARAHEAEWLLFKGVVAPRGSISGERHAIGFAKKPYLSMELSGEEIAVISG